MPAEIRDTLAEAAAAVADGYSPDWDKLESSAGDQDRAAIRRLRAISDIGRLSIELSLTGSIDTPLAARSIPEVWGSLRILEKLGCGRFGDVYRAWDPALDRDVALKILRNIDGDDAVATHVVEEGRLMARVRHPNVLTIHGAQRIDGTTGLWMEFVNGCTLAAELAERGPFKADEIARVGIQLTAALGAVHKAGLVHRDVKAQNVLRDDAGRVVLGDFGAGHELERSASFTGPLAGTPTHLAPELFTGGTATPQSDVYSLGVLLFQLATRGYPVAGRSLRDLRNAHAEGRRTALRSLRPDLPAPLAQAIETALDPEPTRRFQSAEAMGRALEACIAIPTRTRRSRTGLVGVAAGLILATVVSALAWRAGRVDPPPIPFAQRDWVLVTAFDNRTGETSLDGALEYALERELSNTGFVNVVPRSRIADTLLLMRKPIETRIDEHIAREVAIRDGQIQALIAGRVEKIGGVYSMTARIVRPADGFTAGSVQEAAIAPPDLLRGVGRIAATLRRELGEARPAANPKELALQKVATQSMRALQLYSKARAMGGEGYLFSDRQTPRTVEKLLNDALQEDPYFVWALILQAHAIDMQGGRNSEVIGLLERAVAASVPGVERYVAEAELDAYRGEFSTDPTERVRYWESSLVNFHAALQLQPDHYWALSCVLNITGNKLGRSVPSDVLRRFVELRPNNLATYEVASRHAFGSGHLADAREYAKRGRALLNLRGNGPFPPGAGGLVLFPTRDAWRHKRYAQALSEADLVLSNPALASGDLLNFYLALGRWDRAEQVASRMFAPRMLPDAASRFRILIARERGDRDVVLRLVREHLAKHGTLIGANSLMAADLVLALLDARMFDEAHRELAKMKQAPRVAAHQIDVPSLLEGLVAAADGRASKAIRLLEGFLETNISRSPLRFRASLGLAEARAAIGEPLEAIAVLEAASREATGGEFLDASVQYVRMRDRLAQLYRQVARTDEAETIESDLRDILHAAPDEHPIKRRLALLRTSRPIAHPRESSQTVIRESGQATASLHP